MPRFFIDSSDGDLLVVDDEGFDLADHQVARRTAIEVLPAMAREKLPDGEHRTFSVRVRDQGGAVLYEATLVFSGRWRVDPTVASPGAGAGNH